jgi:hypothetical protein
MSDEKRIKLTITMPDSVIWLMRRARAERHIRTDSAAIEQALRDWAAGPKKESEIPLAISLEDINMKLTEPDRALLRMLIAILSAGKDDAIRFVREHLTFFYKYCGGNPDAVRPIDLIPLGTPNRVTCPSDRPE